MENELFLSNFQNIIQNHIANWAGVMQGYAMNLFIILAGIALIVNVVLIILESGGGIDTNKIISFILKFSFVTGFFFFILENGIEFANYIIKYFLTIGNDSLGYGTDDKGAVENILNSIYSIWNAATKELSGWSIAEYIASVFLAIFIIIILAIILGNYLVEVMSSFILVYAGYIVLAFGATQWTREWVINYFKAVLGIGLKLLTLMFLIGITLEFLKIQISMFKNGFHITNGITILVTLFIIQMIMNKVPDAVAALVSSAWGHMSGLNMATAAATIMAAAQTAKTAMSVMNKAGGAALEGAKNYKTGTNDAANEYIKNKYSTAAGAAANQNDTFTPNNREIPGFNENTKNGSGIMYQMGRATGWGFSNLYDGLKNKNKQSSNNASKKDSSSNTDASNTSSKPVQNQADSNIKNN